MGNNISCISTKWEKKRCESVNLSPKCESDFYMLRNRCLEEGRLFKDSTFPAQNSSLAVSDRTKENIKWLRPSQITGDPHLFVDDQSRFDVVQGALGNCWMISAVACLTLNKELFNQVVPRDQSFTNNYAGIFHFRFWQYGEWVDVVIDDRLPTIGGKLVYMHSKSPNEFWSALLEKAYAKLYGSYEALRGGTPSEAFQDMTGGISKRIDLKEKAPPRLNEIMLKSVRKGVLFGCGIYANTTGKEELKKQGLDTGHAYSITGMHIVKFQEKDVYLLRIRNPHGNKEWNGAWCDGCSNWDEVSEDVKEKLGIRFHKGGGGEFHMCIDDFLNIFSVIDICFLNPGQMYEFGKLKYFGFEWTTKIFHGAWIPQKERTENSDYIEGPPYRIKLRHRDPKHDHDLTVMIAVIQKNRRKMMLRNEKIGIKVSEVNEELTYELEKEEPRIRTREVTLRGRLPPGEYNIVPFMKTSLIPFQLELKGDFMLRIFTNGIIESSKVKRSLFSRH